MTLAARTTARVTEKPANRNVALPSQRTPSVSTLTTAVAGVPRFLQRTADSAMAISTATIPRFLQAKFAISQPGDSLEQEADQVAEQVMRAPLPANQTQCTGCAGGPPCAACAADTGLQRKADLASGGQVEAVASDVLGRAGPAQSLDHATRSHFEPRFGRDFSGVRVHAGVAAESSAHAVNARAYTVGQHIVFGAGQLSPSTDSGRRLLAHELAHVVQQTGGGAAGGASLMPAAAMIARESYPVPAPMPGALPPSGPPPMPQAPVKKQTQAPAPNQPTPVATQSRAGAPAGTNGSFGKDSPTEALRRWEYVVYADHVRIGNRKVDDTPGGPVIGSWPWMTNNPGDLTGDVKPRKESKDDPASYYRQDKRIWGESIQRGAKPDTMTAVSGANASGLSANNTAIAGYAARTDLAIFADRDRGRRALQEWISKYYGSLTLAASVKVHLGPSSSHVAGVDDPEKYPKLLQQFMSDKGYASDYVSKTKGADVQASAWSDVIDAFGYAEGFYNRRAVTGEPGKFRYVENKGITYRCSGRDAIDVDPAYSNLSRVTNLPAATPPEIKSLLGCP